MLRATLLVAAVSAALAAPAAAAPEIHAHRGGTVSNGKPTYSEETLQAYKRAAANGFVLEVDAKLTRDGVPVAVHDATLDRTTTCSGEVRAYTLTRLRSCRFDVLGSPGGGLRTRATKPAGRIATIAEVLELARLTGSRVNLEIKNLPTDPDWDPTPGYANRIMDVVKAARLNRSQLLIQSFIATNLDVAKQRIRHVRTSVLALSVSDALVTLAKDKGYDYVSPQWPFSAAFVRQVHAAGALALPFTLDKRADVRAAARAKVDGLITDDPLMAAGALGLRPARALTAKLSRHLGRIVARGTLRLPPGIARRRGCSGRITLRVLGAKRALHARRAPLAGDCTYTLAVTVPRGAPAE